MLRRLNWSLISKLWGISRINFCPSPNLRIHPMSTKPSKQCSETTQQNTVQLLPSSTPTSTPPKPLLLHKRSISESVQGTGTMNPKKLEEVYMYLERVVGFLGPSLSFLNAHTVDYFPKSHRTNLLPRELRTDLDTLDLARLKAVIREWAGSFGNVIPNQNQAESTIVPFPQSNLPQLLSSIAQLLPEPNIISTNPNQSFGSCSLKFDPIMPEKKMHEVEVMARFIDQIIRRRDLNENGETVLVDLGSGKGYLGSFLSLKYQYPVLDIESQSSNVEGSQARTNRIQKVWPGLVRRAEERSLKGSCVKRGRNWKKKLNIPVAQGIKSPKSLDSTDSDSSESGYPGNKINSKNSLHHSLNLYVTPEMNLGEILNERYSKKESDSVDFGLIGLHTCGNLGTSSIFHFLKNPQAKFLINVPCCYHHLVEPDFRNPASYKDESPHTLQLKRKIELEGTQHNFSPTFPLSKFLIDREFNLGRNARMMSSYTLSRMLQEDSNTQILIIWRTILQVIFSQKLGETMDLSGYKIGRIGSKCTNFVEYVRMGLHKFGLENAIKISDPEINSIYEAYEPQIDQLLCYTTIRNLFAPLVEAVILADRLAYLLEQEVVGDAYILRLFDPFLSPRSNAILGFKKSEFHDFGS